MKFLVKPRIEFLCKIIFSKEEQRRLEAARRAAEEAERLRRVGCVSHGASVRLFLVTSLCAGGGAAVEEATVREEESGTVQDIADWARRRYAARRVGIIAQC